MADLQQAYRPTANAVATEVAGEAVVLNAKTEFYFSLNETGTVAWAIFGKGGSGADAVDAICERYEAPREQVEQDVGQLIERLLEAGLLEPSSP